MSYVRIIAILAGLVACAGAGADELLPVRQITHGPKFHWFGYYDKLEFGPTSRYVLANEVDFEGRSPTADDILRVGLVDLADHDKWIELGTSRAWCWQQGCNLQWLPGSKSEVVWNDREGDRFVCRVLDVFTRAGRTIPMTIHGFMPDGRHALAADFRRIQDHRPGYGYPGLSDPCKDEAAPRDSGIWSIDVETGQSKLFVSIAQIVAVPSENIDPEEFRTSRHWLNHPVTNPDGSRLLFLHRWVTAADGKYAGKYKSVGGFGTRLLTANLDGTDLFVLDPHGKTSHFAWKNPQTLTAWAWQPSQGSHFYDFRDRTREVLVVGRDAMRVNGHITYPGGAAEGWILNDTYPDAQRFQTPYLYHPATNRRVDLGHFRSPPEYRGEWRCDTHPRSDPTGNEIRSFGQSCNPTKSMLLPDLRTFVTCESTRLSTWDTTTGQLVREVNLPVASSSNMYFGGSPFLPVECVTWDAAMDWCQALGRVESKARRIPARYECRLPTETEWELAARTEGERVVTSSSSRGHWHAETSGWRLHEVGESSPNKWGLFDIQGNVSEWCLDGYRENYQDDGLRLENYVYRNPDPNTGYLRESS